VVNRWQPLYKKSQQFEPRMKRRKTAYELSASQVVTPVDVVSLFWRLAGKRRKSLGSVLDLGAGDCRFARDGSFSRYVGIEIDSTRSHQAALPKNGKLITDCAFRHPGKNYDTCIGNPPYVRHHFIESPWKEETVTAIETSLGVTLKRNCNLYIYFLCLGLIKTKSKGLVAMIIPYEWVSRPSASPIRDYIRKKRWNVTVYRFQEGIFDGVMTTASVSIIDKNSSEGRWDFFDLNKEFKVLSRIGAADAKDGVIKYENRGVAWALRGMSPGTQKVFTLTEGERNHFGLKKIDVVPCVTTLKHVPANVRILTKGAFRKHFIDAGERCWLIKSFCKKLSPTLRAYLKFVPPALRDTWTCHNQKPWYRFSVHPTPQLLVASGFTSFGPKVVVNQVGALAVGSVWGIHSRHRLQSRKLQQHLYGIDVEKRVVAHAEKLKKIEVKQLNALLNAFHEQQRTKN
jgi:predicted RNA methylase